jgi:hypothetical protein
MRFLAVFLVGLFVTPALAYTPGEVVGTVFACKSEESIKMLTKADRVSKEKAKAAFKFLAKSGECGLLGRPVPAQLVKMVDAYVDFAGKKNEAWKIHNGFYIIVLDPNSKSSYSI